MIAATYVLQHRSWPGTLHRGGTLHEVGQVDLVSPGEMGVPQLTPHIAGQDTQVPNYAEIVNSLNALSGTTTANYAVVIRYEDVQKRRSESVMQMGMNGTRLLRDRQTDG